MKLEELRVNGTAVRDQADMERETAEFWGRIGGMYESVEENEVNLEIEGKVNEFMDAEISREEISKCVKTLKNGKAFGMVGIPYEFCVQGRGFWYGEWSI